jgi:hypothetical protein
MFIKLVTLIVLLSSVNASGFNSPVVHVADDGGDLNPQPLPPIAEDEFGGLG